jgi:predicted RND superfamily exporter protein
MDKEQLAEKATEALRPFETANLMNTIQNLTLKQIFTHPPFLIIVTAVFFFGVVKRSKTILLTLFTLIAFIVIARFAMPAPGEELSVHSMLPFIFGGLLIGGVIIYFTLIKSD